MGTNNTFHVQVQPPDDLIDFPVSDSFREHYAAQGLTYSSGPTYRPQKQHRPNKALARERDDWMARAIETEAQYAELEEKFERLQRQYTKLHQHVQRFQRTSPSNKGQKYRGVDLDDCA